MIEGTNLEFGSYSNVLQPVNHLKDISIFDHRGCYPLVLMKIRGKPFTELEHLLAHSEARLKLIITDGVFSMDGNVAPIKGLRDLADRYRAILAVDDSHATGFFGETGR